VDTHHKTLEAEAACCDSAARCAGSGLRIHLGCGADCRPGWLNVDIQRLQPASVEFLRCDLLELDRLVEDDCASEIVAQDVLQRVSWKEVDRVLGALVRKLRVGGVLYVQAPDLARIADGYLDGTLDHFTAQRYLFGDQDPAGHVHQNVWSATELVRRFRKAELSVLRVQLIDFHVCGWGRRSL
jgi:predicted SAM-dependent methyltransferase